MSYLVKKKYGQDPYLILISCLLSLRARDASVYPVCKKLFKLAQSPQEMMSIPVATLEEILYSIGFYKKKAQVLHVVSRQLIDKFNGQVPQTLVELMNLPGVGLKTANLVLAEGFNIPAICVDIHVHRISNRLGIIKTATPEQTEYALKKVLPMQYWIEWNRLLVMWGQNICTPQSPWCSRCAIFDDCQRKGVDRSR